MELLSIPTGVRYLNKKLGNEENWNQVKASRLKQGKENALDGANDTQLVEAINVHESSEVRLSDGIVGMDNQQAMDNNSNADQAPASTTVRINDTEPDEQAGNKKKKKKQKKHPPIMGKKRDSGIAPSQYETSH
ncbi:unnamed protein product [Ilex paraguariensis]|uniref:Uncharacterized protein n=1 Tax=Ilex paraguariensis TaxID=185542 RepID=A0ABC8RGA9_9AQUA